MGKAEIRYLMVGRCDRCGKEFVRPALCDVAACDCESAVEVPLQPVLLLPARIYARFQAFADKAGVTIEELVNAFLGWCVENYESLKTK